MKNRINTFISGLIIGAVEIIPGVSGGTMALILGIYEKLIVSIETSTTPEYASFLRPGDPRLSPSP